MVEALVLLCICLLERHPSAPWCPHPAWAKLSVYRTRCAPHPQDAGEYEAAEAYYTRLLDFGAGSREAAKSSLREIRTLQVGRCTAWWARCLEARMHTVHARVALFCCCSVHES